MDAPLTALVLGGVAWNTMVYVDALPGPHPQTVFPQRSHRTVGSSGAGKALNLAGLGADVTLWGLIGDDPEGEAIRAVFDQAGVEFIGHDDPLGTERHTNLMDSSGERISIFVNAGSLDAAIDATFAEPLLAVSDLVAITIKDHCRAFLEPARRSRTPVWIDIHDYDGRNPYHRDFIEAADHLMVSSVLLPGWRSFAEQRIEAGAETVIVTHGADGASGIDQSGTWVDVEAQPAEVVDSNGAGDAFFAGFAVARHAGADMGAAMEAGSAQAAAAVASPDLAPKPRSG